MRWFSIYVSIVFAIATALCQVSFASSNIANVSTSVHVPCVFGMSLSPTNPIFVLTAGAQVDYSIESLVECSISQLSGNFVLANSVSNIAYYTTNTVFNGISQTPTNGVFSIPSNSLQLGDGKATLTLNSLEYSNFTQLNYQVVTAANVFIASASVSPTNPSIGATLSAVTNVTNDGSLAATNMILNIMITGPGSFTYSTNVVLSSLSPSQTENTDFSINGATPYSGTYSLMENVSYQTIFTQNSVTYTLNEISSNTTLTYTVPSTGGGGGGGAPKAPLTPTSISLLSFTEMPLQTTVLAGNSTAVNLGLHNSGAVQLWVNITLPTFRFGSLNISASSILLQPGQTQYVQLLLTGASNFTPSVSYVLPINFSVAAVGSAPSYGQFYTAFKLTSLQPPSKLLLQSSTYTFSSTKSVLTQLSVYNPTNKTVYDAVVSTQLPTTVVQQNLTLTLTGESHNVTLLDNQYVLQWKIPQLQPHGTTTLTYSISNVVSSSYFLQPITTLSTISPQPISTLRVFDIKVPTFYVGKSSNITVSAIYTGTNETNITLNLQPPAGIFVKGQVQRTTVYPNTAFTTVFQISPIDMSGTSVFQLFVSSPSVNQSYVLPAVVLPQGLNSSSSTQQISSSAVSSISMYENATVYLLSGAVLLLVVAAVYLVYRRMTASTYNSERAKLMIRMKQRVKRELEGEEGKE